MMEGPLRDAYLEAMGIQRWVRRGRGPAEAAVPAAEAAADPMAVDSAAEPRAIAVAELDWTQLEAAVAGCTRCALAQTRTQTVFGTGNREADWLIIGEAPGADEDRRGEPFVGPAGQLLTRMLRAVGLGREEVYITNILKCRPPGNRDPLPEEVASCHEYLERQVALARPRLMLAVGRVAAQNLLQTDTPVGRLRGIVHYYGNHKIPLVVTYHPAYLLRSPLEKRKVWADLQLAQQVYRGG